MDTTWLIIWACVAIVTLIVELCTVGLVSIWLTGGALVALVLCAFKFDTWVQVVAFFAVSFILIFLTRPWARKFVKSKKVPTNYEDAIGKEVRVTEIIDNTRETGRAFYNGVDWAARSLTDSVTFEKDELAKVVSVEGVKLILEKIN